MAARSNRPQGEEIEQHLYIEQAVRHCLVVMMLSLRATSRSGLLDRLPAALRCCSGGRSSADWFEGVNEHFNTFRHIIERTGPPGSQGNNRPGRVRPVRAAAMSSKIRS